MTIKKGDKVKVEYTLKLDNGDLVDSSEGKSPLEFEVGSGAVIPGFDQAVIGMKKNDAKDVKVSPADGYGDKRSELIQEVPMEPFRKAQKKNPEINMILTLASKDGQKMMARVVKLDKKNDKMTLDFNHILSGQNLNFHIKLLDFASNKL